VELDQWETALSLVGDGEPARAFSFSAAEDVPCVCTAAVSLRNDMLFSLLSPKPTLTLFFNFFALSPSLPCSSTPCPFARSDAGALAVAFPCSLLLLALPHARVLMSASFPPSSVSSTLRSTATPSARSARAGPASGEERSGRIVCRRGASEGRLGWTAVNDDARCDVLAVVVGVVGMVVVEEDLRTVNVMAWAWDEHLCAAAAAAAERKEGGRGE